MIFVQDQQWPSHLGNSILHEIEMAGLGRHYGLTLSVTLLLNETKTGDGIVARSKVHSDWASYELVGALSRCAVVDKFTNARALWLS